MAAPLVATTGTYNATATLASNTLTAVQSSIAVTGLSLTRNASIAELKDGANTTLGAIAHDIYDELKVDFVYKGTNFPRPVPLEIITVSAASSTSCNGEWYYKGDLTATFTAGDFTKYTMTLGKEFQEAGAVVVDLTP